MIVVHSTQVSLSNEVSLKCLVCPESSVIDEVLGGGNTVHTKIIIITAQVTLHP